MHNNKYINYYPTSMFVYLILTEKYYLMNNEFQNLCTNFKVEDFNICVRISKLSMNCQNYVVCKTEICL